MSNDQYPDWKLMTSPGHARRRFLERSALAAAGASAAALLPVTSEASAKAKQVPAGICPDPKAPMKDVAGKVAFITGGTSGIGLGAAKAFVNAGMKVVIAGISEKHIDEALAHFAAAGQAAQVHAISVNVTDRAAMAAAAAETVKMFGKVHVLFNNAGVFIPQPLGEIVPKDWNWLMDVNVNGVLNGIHAFLPLIRSHGEGGQIMATSSVLGLFVWENPGAAYVASKFAVMGMMESLRTELADTPIGVSILCPGWVSSNLGSSSRSQQPGAAWSEQQKQAAVEAGLIMDPMEIGEMTLRGMRHNALYILTHPEWSPMLENRHQVLMASIPQGMRLAEERASKAQDMTERSIYTAELNRKRCKR